MLVSSLAFLVSAAFSFIDESYAVDILNDSSLINPRHDFMKTVKPPYYFGSDNSTMPFYSVHGGTFLYIL